MIISIIGSADAGKTTLINELIDRKVDIFGEREIIYKGDGDIFLINLFKKFFGTSQTKSVVDSKLYSTKISDTKKKILHYLYLYLYFFAVFLDYSGDYLKYEVFNKNKILLKDRYIYDFYITYLVNFEVNNKFINWTIKNFPKPKILIYLSVNSENLFKRNKNNLPGAKTSRKEFFDEVAENYSVLANEVGAYEIDNNEDLHNTVKNAENFIKTKLRLANLKRIIVCGPDGAGKSTLIRGVSTTLNEIGIGTKTVHFYHDTLLYKILKGIGFFKSEKTEELQHKKNLERSKKNEGKSKPYWWALLNVVDAYMQITFAEIFRFNKVIIYDRYLYDFLVSFEYYKVPRYKGLLRHLRMRQNTFVIVSEPKVLYSRKPENLFSYFEFAYNKYIEVARTFSMKVIDTTSTNAQEALNKLWHEL